MDKSPQAEMRTTEVSEQPAKTDGKRSARAAYLAAMGVDVWVRRGLEREAGDAAPEIVDDAISMATPAEDSAMPPMATPAEDFAMPPMVVFAYGDICIAVAEEVLQSQALSTGFVDDLVLAVTGERRRAEVCNAPDMALTNRLIVLGCDEVESSVPVQTVFFKDCSELSQATARRQLWLQLQELIANGA